MNTKKYPKKILLLVTGMSPQVVTETLFALVTEQKFIPTEIHLITTQNGKNRAMRDLLDKKDGRFHAFCQEYGLTGKIHFEESNILVIKNKRGEPLPDIRTPEENGFAADEIIRCVQKFCADDNAALHVSIAGGRKTMGFFLGYALSLFARPQDKLSHVLVSEPFENNKDFFYPSQQSKLIITAEGRALDASQAKVMLAEIPLVHLRSGLNENLLNGNINYSDVVRIAQAEILPNVELRFSASDYLIRCGNTDIRLKPVEYAVFLWMAQLKKQGRSIRPGDDIGTDDFLTLYQKILPKISSRYDNAERSLKSDDDFLPYFQEKKTRINNVLKRHLGNAAKNYTINPTGKRPKTQYQLATPEDAIFLPKI